MFNMNKKSKNNSQEEPIVQPDELQDMDMNTEVNTEEASQDEAGAVETEEIQDPVQAEREKYLRLYSEFENFRRRTTKERLDWMQTASKELMVQMLPIVDDMERAIKSMQQADNSSAVEGMELIYKKMYSTLEKKGLKPMNAQGETFDPEVHEAVTQFDAPSEDMKGKVIDVLEKGYFLNDKVIRFAKVVVGK